MIGSWTTFYKIGRILTVSPIALVGLMCSAAITAQTLVPAPQDSFALGSRTPLILIHGWEWTNHTGETVMEGNSAAWNTFLKRFVTGSGTYDQNLVSSVKPYLFTYVTSAGTETDD